METSIKINRKSFMSAIRAVGLRDNNFPLVTMSGDGNRIVITAVSRDEQARAHVSIRTAFPEIAISGKLADKFLSVMGDAEISLRITEKEVLLEDSTSCFHLPMAQKTAVMPFSEPDDFLGEIKLTEEIVQALSMLPGLIDKGETAPMFMGVHFVAADGLCHVMAINRHSLVEQLVPADGKFDINVEPAIFSHMEEGGKLRFFKKTVEIISEDNNEFYAPVLVNEEGKTSSLFATATGKISPKEVEVKRLDLIAAAEKCGVVASIGEGGHEVACVLSGTQDGKALKLSVKTEVGATEALIPLLKPADVAGYREGIAPRALLALKKRKSVMLKIRLGEAGPATAFAVREQTAGKEKDFLYVFTAVRLH